MIWTTILIWLIAAGVLAGLAGLFALSEGPLALIVIPVAFGIFVFPIAGAIAGYQAAHGNASLAISLGISFVLGLIVFSFSNGNSDTFGVDSLIAFAPLLAVLLSFGLTHFILYAKGVHILLHVVSILSFFSICLVYIYLLGAYQSRMAYLGLPKELFFVCPQNDITSVRVCPNKGVLLTQTGELFSGKIIGYKEHLNLNFWSKKESGIAYYKDGLRFGQSGDIVLLGRFNSVSYEGTNEWHINAPENQNNTHTLLLHKDYQNIIETEFLANEIVYYQEIADKQPNRLDPYPLPSITIVLANDSMIVRKYVSFHYNGVVKSIESSVLKSKVAEWNRDMYSFDQLGFRNVYESKKVWDKNDFVEMQFDSYQTIKVKNDASLLPNPIQNADKMLYVPEPENWKHDNMVDNLVAVHGFPLTKMFTAIPVGGYWKWLKNDEATDLCQLIHNSTLTINYQDDEITTYNFQKNATKIYIQSEQKDKTIILYFANDKILVNDGPYYFDVSVEKLNESIEDRVFHKKIYNNVLKIVEKYRTHEEEEFLENENEN